MPWSQDERGGLHGPTVWRVLIVGAVILAAAGIALNAALFRSNRTAIESTRDLSCRIGSFFVGQPIVRQPGQTEGDFEQTVRKAERFLRALRDEDCSSVAGASISAQQITRQLHHLHGVVPRGGGAGNPGGNPGGQPGPPPGGPPDHKPPPQPDCTVEVNPATGERICVDVTVPKVP